MPYPVILHISDLHRKSRSGADNRSILRFFQGDIERQYETDNRLLKLTGTELELRPPNILVVTGDVAYRAAPSEYNGGGDHDAVGLLDGLASRYLDGDRARVVLLPGNHDVSWPLFDDCLTACVPEDGATDPEWIREVRSGSSVTSYRVNAAKYGERLRPFTNFTEAYYGRTQRFPILDGFKVFDFSRDWDIVVTALSSVTRNDRHDASAIIREDDVHRAANFLDSMDLPERVIRVAAWHHGVAAEPGQRDYVPKGTVSLLRTLGFHMGLHGHVHQSEFDRVGRGHTGGFPVVGAGTIGADAEDRPDGIGFEYNLITFSGNGERAFVHTRHRLGRNLPWEPKFWQTPAKYVDYFEVRLKE